MALRKTVRSVENYMNVQDMVVCALIVLVIAVDPIVKVVNWVSIDCPKAKVNVPLVDVIQLVS